MKEMEQSKLNKLLLSKPNFNQEDCSYNFLYEEGSQKLSFIFTGWGEIHIWDHSRDVQSRP